VSKETSVLRYVLQDQLYSSMNTCHTNFTQLCVGKCCKTKIKIPELGYKEEVTVCDRAIAERHMRKVANRWRVLSLSMKLN